MIDQVLPACPIPSFTPHRDAAADIWTGRRLRRLMLYAHDTYGLGHLRRNLAIASHLLRTTEQLQIVLVSGSPVAARFPLPRGLSLVRLPSVVKVAPEEYASRDGQVSFGIVSRARAAIIADIARRFQPDALLVDHAPQGMKGELLPTFEVLRRHVPETRIVLGLRDVLDDPTAVRETWAAQGVLDTLEDVYHRVLVYGSRDLLDVGAAYGIPARLRPRISYCGYVARDLNFKDAMSQATGAGLSANSAARAGGATHPKHIALSGGTGSAGGGSGLAYTAQTQPTVDGNSVDLDRERANFVDNSVRYEATLRFINGSAKGILSAIQGQ